jgi:dihydroorotase
MANSAYFLRNATIVNEGQTFKGSLLLNNGKIEKIFRTPAPGPVSEKYQPIELEGLLLIPGAIDDQVHFREPGLTQKGDLYIPSRGRQ